MRPSIRSRLIALVRAQWAGLLALFLVIAGGTAYAANTIRSSDIVNGEVKSVDIGNNQVQSVDVRDDTLTNGGLTDADLGPNAAGLSELNPTAFQADDISPTGVFNRFQISNDAIQGNEVQDNVLTGADIANGTLKDEDIAQGTFVNFTGVIGNVPAQSCVEQEVSGVNNVGDHLLLTPDFETQSQFLIYSAETANGNGSMLIQACNPTTAAINDGNTNFSLLVIDAQ